MVEHPREMEEKYFHAREAELRKKLRKEAEQAAAAERERRLMASHAGTDDAAVLERLRRLGFNGESARALHLLPLVGVAWADGAVSARERAIVMQAAEASGIEPGSEAATFLASMLEARPSDTLRSEVKVLLKDMLAAKGMEPQSLLELCEDVARASGGLLGMGIGDKIAPEEREMLTEISEALGPGALDRFNRDD